MRCSLIIAAVTLLLLVNGCGSLSSRWRGGIGAYQGVRFDCEQVAHYSTESELVAAADIPLSAVVDTLFLPYDLASKEKAEAGSSDSADRSGPPRVNPASGRIGYK